MSDDPITIEDWVAQGHSYPKTKHAWYNILRGGKLRDELIAAGAVTKLNGRWLINPAKFRELCANRLRTS